MTLSTSRTNTTNKTYRFKLLSQGFRSAWHSQPNCGNTFQPDWQVRCLTEFQAGTGGAEGSTTSLSILIIILVIYNYSIKLRTKKLLVPRCRGVSAD